MGFLDLLTGRARARNAVAALYAATVAQARRPEFYTALGVPDTLDGRFELLVLHVHLACRRLTAANGAASAQALFDSLFHDMDRNLRELGVSDPSVPRRVKAMIEAYYGRVKAYEAALAADGSALAATIARNVFNAETPPAALQLADYVRRAVARLDTIDAAALADGRVEFPPVLMASVAA